MKKGIRQGQNTSSAEMTNDMLVRVLVENPGPGLCAETQKNYFMLIHSIITSRPVFRLPDSTPCSVNTGIPSFETTGNEQEVTGKNEILKTINK